MIKFSTFKIEVTVPTTFFLLLMFILFVLNHEDPLEFLVVAGATLSDPS